MLRQPEGSPCRRKLGIPRLQSSPSHSTDKQVTSKAGEPQESPVWAGLHTSIGSVDEALGGGGGRGVDAQQKPTSWAGATREATVLDCPCHSTRPGSRKHINSGLRTLWGTMPTQGPAGVSARLKRSQLTGNPLSGLIFPRKEGA